MVFRYIDFVKANGYFERRRNEQSKYWMYETINEHLRNSFYNNPDIASMLLEKEREVLEGRTTSFTAARKLLDTYLNICRHGNRIQAYCRMGGRAAHHGLFLVVFAHCCDPFVARFDSDRSAFLQGCALGSAVRCCVPLFVMMTGVLLFPVRPAGMGDFYRKRIGRIVVPLLFWSVALPLLFFFHLNYVVTTDNPTVDMQTFTPGMTLTKIYTCIFNFNYDTTPLWYLYMLAGLYLVIPVFGAWLEKASRKDILLS